MQTCFGVHPSVEDILDNARPLPDGGPIKRTSIKGSGISHSQLVSSPSACPLTQGTTSGSSPSPSPAQASSAKMAATRGFVAAKSCNPFLASKRAS